MRLVSKSLGIKYDVASQNPRIDNPVISLQDNRIDSAWFNFAFVLIEEQGAGFPDLRSTLLCFGTVSRLHEAFDALALSDIQLNDPYFVFVPVLRSIWRSIDDVSWLLADVFREVEKVSDNRTPTRRLIITIEDHSQAHSSERAWRNVGRLCRAARHLQA